MKTSCKTKVCHDNVHYKNSRPKNFTGENIVQQNKFVMIMSITKTAAP
jgi:hypothetical protein